jgi:hypothetical protein
MKSARKVIIVLIVIGFGIFGYTQYVSATQIGVIVTENEFLERTDKGSVYSVQLEFDNPSLLILNAGETDFSIIVEDTKVADGVLEPFTLPSMSKVNVKGTYLEEEKSKIKDEQSSRVKISGITKYDVFFTSIEVPFIYFPSEEQARGFIHQK